MHNRRFGINYEHNFSAGIGNTVKLGNKEQIGIKEPFPVTNLPFTL